MAEIANGDYASATRLSRTIVRWRKEEMTQLLGLERHGSLLSPACLPMVNTRRLSTTSRLDWDQTIVGPRAGVVSFEYRRRGSHARGLRAMVARCC
jgi:hypothetical protein